MNRPRVYIAGPYTKPDPCENTHIALEWANKFWDLGYVPFVPRLTHFWHTMTPRPYEQWLDYDNQFLAVCHVVFRFPGESSGADKECALAEQLGIPVFYSLDEVHLYLSRLQTT